MIITRFCILYFLFWSIHISLSAQGEEVDVTKNFRFRDGIYFSFSSFRANRPDLEWDQVTTSLFTNPQNYLTQVAFIRKETDTLNLEKLWGICLDGLPFVRLPEGAVDKKMTTFAALLLRGKICYFTYEREEAREIPMPVYNPLTGKPFRSSNVIRKVKLRFEKILHFETGEVKDFTLENVKNWIQDDTDLSSKVAALTPEAAEEELLEILIDYVDRNIVFVQE